MTVFLDGIATQFYRGIGAEVQFIAPFSRMNFFIGANNSGKSIVLNLLASQVSAVASGKVAGVLNGPEAYRGRETGSFMMAIGRATESTIDKIGQLHPGLSLRPRSSAPNPLNVDIQKICENLSKHGCIWTEPQDSRNSELYPRVDVSSASGWSGEWESIWNTLTRKSGGSAAQHWVPETVACIVKAAKPSLPSIHLIPAKRVLGATGEAFDDLSGRGLIDHLATLQNPAWDRQDDRDKFMRINMFLQEVTGKSKATLEVPSGRGHLLVHMDNKVLPLSSLGSGIHEVILIAAFCTIHDDSIMCIEEPEIHLHPLLQRKLVNYLEQNTGSQYFIATHSSAFIDTPAANVFHVTNDGEQTRVRAALTKNEQRGILNDLGYHASDLLQTNAVIWVEGPSDRIYLNHWVKAVDATLQEGIHYTIMFYGGGLIKHLTASDDAFEGFIKLRDLNRNMAIVLDSDRGSPSDDLKPHAQRLVDEMAKDGGIVWVTAGREIKNYVDGKKLQAALKELHPRLYVQAGKTGQYDHAFYFYRENPSRAGRNETYKKGDKVGAASKICQESPDLGQLDLQERIQELIQMIRDANDL